MEPRKVIDDRHYNGKTGNERLAFEGLLDQLTAAVQEKDARLMVEFLEGALITHAWATRLTTMILEEPSQSPIHFSLDDSRNAGLIRYFKHCNELKFPACMRPVESPRD